MERISPDVRTPNRRRPSIRQVIRRMPRRYPVQGPWARAHFGTGAREFRAPAGCKKPARRILVVDARRSRAHDRLRSRRSPLLLACQPTCSHRRRMIASTAGASDRSRFFAPDTAPRALVFLFSDASGWDATLDRAAATLRDDGAAVVGVDLPSYEKGLRASDDGCHYLLSEIEALSQQIAAQGRRRGLPDADPRRHRRGRDARLRRARPGARGDGGGRGERRSGAVARRRACRSAPALRRIPVSGARLRVRSEVGPARLVDRRVARRRSRPISRRSPRRSTIRRRPTRPAPDRLVALLAAQIDAGDASPALRNLPLTEIPAAKPGSWMAVVVSGDGGWRDLDKEIGEQLAARGAPVVGVDSLRYFWSAKTPDEVARDLAAIIDAYGDSWGTQKVVLVGYSFGAAVLPFAVNDCPPAMRARVDPGVAAGSRCARAVPDRSRRLARRRSRATKLRS